MRRRLLPVLLLAALALPGCLGALEAHGPVAPEREAEPAPEAGPMNQFLLEQARPFHLRVSGGAEPSILVDHQDRWVWIGDTSGLYRSSDGGETWHRLPVRMAPRYVFGDGYALAQDAAGALYVADTNGQLVSVARSTDGGDTWSAPNWAADVGAIADRPWLAARADGVVALVTNNAGEERCAMSTDGGMTFPHRSLVNHAHPNAGNVVFDADGRLWLSDGAQVWRWSNPCLNAPLPIPLPPSGAQIFTQVALDDQGLPYVAQPSPDNGAMELRRIDGRNVETLVVSPPELKSNTFGTLSVHGDEIAVAWYGSETSGDPSSTSFEGAWNVFVARVKGFGTASPSITLDRITTEPNHVGDFCMSGVGCTTGDGDRDLLDYFMVDHGPDGTLHVAFGHDGTGTRGEVRYARLPPLA